MNFGAFERDEKEFKPKWIIMNYKNIITSTYIINLFMFNINNVYLWSVLLK
jgi:hypothetical protein